jgi:hypothetical protein
MALVTRLQELQAEQRRETNPLVECKFLSENEHRANVIRPFGGVVAILGVPSVVCDVGSVVTEFMVRQVVAILGVPSAFRHNLQANR